MTKRPPIAAWLPLLACLAACAPTEPGPMGPPRVGPSGYDCPALDPRPGGLVEEGMASWYGGKRHHNGPTASGERYDQNAWTAAHRTLPFDALVRVTNLKTGEAAVLRINDRGPRMRKRIIDVSADGAEAIGIKDSGVAMVKIEELDVPHHLPQECYGGPKAR